MRLKTETDLNLFLISEISLNQSKIGLKNYRFTFFGTLGRVGSAKLTL